MLCDSVDCPPIFQTHFNLVPFFVQKVLTFSVFCGIICFVHSDDSFRIVVSATPILSQNRYYGYSFLKIFTLMSIATSFYNAPKLKKSAENGERTACFTFSADFYFCKNTLYRNQIFACFCDLH